MQADIVKISRNITNQLPKIENVINGKNLYAGNKIGVISSTLEKSPDADSFVKKVTDNFSQSNPIAKIKSFAKLDRTSSDCKFFGVESAENIQNKLYNQTALSTIKCDNENIYGFLAANIDETPSSPRMMLKNFPMKRCLEGLYKEGAARWTLNGKLFGSNLEEGTHTIGMVFDKHNQKLYVLDSLPQEASKYYHDKILDAILSKSDMKLTDIIFSSKSQQQLDEYTCNNWTHANIESVRDAIKDGKVLNQEELNEILPNDINSILAEQRQYLEQEHSSEYNSILKLFKNQLFN